MTQPKYAGLVPRTPPGTPTGSIPPWLAKFIVILGLVASYAVPYFAVAVKEVYENRDWLRTGLSGYEIDEWKRENIGIHTAVPTLLK